MPTTPNMLKPMQQFIEPQSPLNNKMLQQSSQAQQQTLMMNQSHSQSKYPLRTESSRSQSKMDSNNDF
jgi:hypothetical protein